jgi:hypothetical protein
MCQKTRVETLVPCSVECLDKMLSGGLRWRPTQPRSSITGLDFITQRLTIRPSINAKLQPIQRVVPRTSSLETAEVATPVIAGGLTHRFIRVALLIYTKMF